MTTLEGSKRRLGSHGPEVFPIALGCMALSGTYGATDDAESIRTIHTALERGITLLDTGDYYGMGHNEMLIARALAGGRRDKALISVKFGVLRTPDGGWAMPDTRPAAVKNFLAYTLRRLGTDHVDIYRPGRLDPAVPIEETIGAIAECVKAGWVRHIGLSEVGVDTIRRAHAVHPIADLQIEYALVSRSAETKIFPVLAELGIGITAYGLFSRGLLTGSKPGRPGDGRGHFPRFSGENLAKNQALVEMLAKLAGERGVPPAALAVAWALAKQKHLVPLVGARTSAQIADSLGALDVTLSPADIEELEAAIPPSAVAGTRYDERVLKTLDSER